MVADLMVAQPLGDREPVWLFLSAALGWIAYADIHTEYLRYLPSSWFPNSDLSLDSLEIRASPLGLAGNGQGLRHIRVPLLPMAITPLQVIRMRSRVSISELI
jgi:hypothetical protein